VIELNLLLIRANLAIVRFFLCLLRRLQMATNAELTAAIAAAAAAQAAEAALCDTLKVNVGATPAELDAQIAAVNAITANAQATLTRDAP
jgi:hypothetical protein